jgi:serine/threonine protein phosphatase PrpC
MGDSYVALEEADGTLLVVFDGLGHGAEAETAARLAVATMERQGGVDLDERVRRCHKALDGTRGVVLSAAWIQPGRLCWLGVGNVEGVVLRRGLAQPAERLLQIGGIVGYRLPALRPATLRLSVGDLLIMATDGIADNFVDETPRRGTPRGIADRILKACAKDTDDALVLVARYRGESP